MCAGTLPCLSTLIACLSAHVSYSILMWQIIIILRLCKLKNLTFKEYQTSNRYAEEG